jgi:photosynthetic reaction center cytochrome c subunit
VAQVLLVVSIGFLAACERPPVDTVQYGFRGQAMGDVTNPRRAAPAMGYPESQPPVPEGGPLAKDVYQNVQVLGDLTIGQFTRLMTTITTWVSPDQGCAYCHNVANLASDDIYTKVVSRRMIQMTQNINSQWSSHVGDNGVNCYTCHRGKNVPEYIWFESTFETAGMTTYGGNRMGQNRPDARVAYSSLPSDPFTFYLMSTDSPSVRLASSGPFPEPDGADFVRSEYTYGLMMNWSRSLGVNCTFCHMTASFQEWEGATPSRITAHHGLNMVRAMNEEYLIPLGPVYPDNRLGPGGDAPKAYCMTCHQGVNKPLGGADAVSAYPSLAR